MRIRFLPFVISLFCMTALLRAADSETGAPLRLVEFGFRAGSSIPSGDEFSQYEIFTAWRTPWAWIHETERLTARLELQAGGGLLRNPDADAGFGYAGPAVRFSAGNAPVYLTLGVAPTYLTRRRFGRDDFGQRLQFTSSASVTWMLTSDFGLRYRLQHMSNARMAKPNPGLNTHSAGVVIAF